MIGLILNIFFFCLGVVTICNPRGISVKVVDGGGVIGRVVGVGNCWCLIPFFNSLA